MRHFLQFAELLDGQEDDHDLVLLVVVSERVLLEYLVHGELGAAFHTLGLVDGCRAGLLHIEGVLHIISVQLVGGDIVAGFLEVLVHYSGVFEELAHG